MDGIDNNKQYLIISLMVSVVSSGFLLLPKVFEIASAKAVVNIRTINIGYHP